MRIGRDCFDAAPKEQPPRKLSGQRTESHSNSEELLVFVHQHTAGASRTLFNGGDESLRYPDRGGVF